ncbi:MAG: amino acid ABC transporter permease, partial [Desulfobacteraceae bacterium]
MTPISLSKSDPNEVKPPITSIGAIGWLRANLFSNVLNSILTIVTVLLLLKVVPPLIKWAFIDSIWYASSEVCKNAAGACWSVIPSNIRLIIFGLYPHAEHWRPFAAMILLFALLFYSQNRKHWKKHLIYIWIAGLLIMGLLMKGGLFGLPAVESTQWGG